MIEIKDLLLRYNNILLSEDIKKKSIAEILFKITKINIEIKDIKIKDGTVFLNIKPIYKNEIFLKKESIFIELEKTLGKKSPKKII